MKVLSEEKGFVLPFTALLIPIFIAMLGLMVDVGVASSNYFRLAHAVDSAAYAALDGYDRLVWEEDDRIEIDYHDAKAKATYYLHANLADATLTNFKIISGGRGVRVEAKVNSPVFFMKMFGFSDRTITSFAEAQLSEP
ncbi:hypothetical protein GN156_06835 [bacterium LRH843]|nr:hypothetical protein [bacterium LRH843]